jgi:RNA polymerase sigma factor (sigma-70 family)
MRDDSEVLDLVARANDGDNDAWDELVERYAGLLLAVCRRYGMTAAATDDVCQTVWLRLVEHLSELDQPAALPGWLRTTAARECLHAIRMAQRQVNFGELVDAEGFDVAADEELTQVDRRLLNHERRKAILTAFDELEADCRRLLSLLAREPRLSYEAISQKLGRPVGSIGPSRLRCLEKLRSHPVLAAYIQPDREG